MSSVTGGETFFYPNFHAPRDLLKIQREIAHAATRETGYQTLMKVRCSNGLQVSSYHGNFVQNALGADLEIGGIDADKAMGVIFSYDGKLDTKLDAHFQAALLYTSADGQRRVRCINVVAGVNEGALETMKFIDQDAVVAVIAKEGKSTPNHSFRRVSILTGQCSGIKDARQEPHGHSCQHLGKDCRHPRRVSQALFRVTSSRPTGAAREPEGVPNVHAESRQVSSIQR